MPPSFHQKRMDLVIPSARVGVGLVVDHFRQRITTGMVGATGKSSSG